MKGDTINITVVNNSIMENAAIHLGMESGRQLKSQEKKKSIYDDYIYSCFLLSLSHDK
jgi:hypothetical protein